MKSKLFGFYTDPGHGWMRVPREVIDQLGIAPQISRYSYQRANWVYLEEDVDMPLVIRELRDRGVSVGLTQYHANGWSKIRRYERFNAEG